MRELNSFSTTLLKIYDAAYAPRAWTEAMDGCKAHTSALYSVFHAQPIQQDLEFTTQGGCSDSVALIPVVKEYNEKFGHPGNTGYDDVGVRYMNNAVAGEPVLDTDIWDLDWLTKRPELIHNRENGFFRKMYVNLSSDPLMHSVVFYLYPSNLSEIPTTDLTAVRFLGPHLYKALDIARWSDGLRRKYNAVLSVLDRFQVGVCLVDRRGHVVLQNTKAKTSMSESGSILIGRDGKLHAKDPDVTQEIAAAIKEVSKTALGESVTSSIEITMTDANKGQPVLLVASPLRDADMELERNLSGCLLTIIDGTVAENLRISAFAKAYGLTPTETGVAERLASGLTTPQIAEDMNVSPSTTETHLKSIFSKTRSNNRVNFIWRVAQFSPPIF